MSINPYLTFDGTCRQAMQRYADILGGEIVLMQTFGESPMAEQFPGDADRVMHATLKVGDDLVLGSDLPGGQTYHPPRGITVQMGFPSLAAAEPVFAALADGGTVTMPFQQTFWAAGFGMLTDRFGIPWMINCDL